MSQTVSLSACKETGSQALSNQFQSTTHKWQKFPTKKSIQSDRSNRDRPYCLSGIHTHNQEIIMHEVDLKQDEKVVTLVIDCSSIEDANRLYLLLEQIFLDDKEQEKTLSSA